MILGQSVLELLCSQTHMDKLQLNIKIKPGENCTVEAAGELFHLPQFPHESPERE